MTTQELWKKIEYHNLLYYQKDKPDITDAEYDEQKRKAIEVGEEIELGAEPDGRFAKVIHLNPMLSLENAHDKNDVEKFLAKVKKLLISC